VDDLPLPALARVEAALAVKPLPHPLRLGASLIERREYAAVRVVDADGVIGKAYCLTRDAPVVEIVERMLVPSLQRIDGGTIAELSDALLRATALVGRVGLVRRALGLLEIALWDLAAQRAGRPVWEVLGAGDAPRETILVACYPASDRGVDEIAAEVLSAASEGWPLVKISRSPDPVLMRELLAILGRELPSSTGLIVDVGFGWRTSEEALRELEAWDPPALAWLEDPFLPEDVDACVRLRGAAGQRIGVGDEVTDPRLLARLADQGAVDVVRTDVVALGGIGPAVAAAESARAAGLEVSAHVYPEVSLHLGVVVETFARSGPGAGRYDPAPSLIREGPLFVRGHAIPPTAPGLGFELDEEAFGLV